MDKGKARSSSLTQMLVTESLRFSTAENHSGLRRYVPNRLLHVTTFAEYSTDNDFKVSPWRRCNSIAPWLDRACDQNPINSSLVHNPLRKCLHGTSLADPNIAGVETLADKGAPVECMDKQFQINFNQSIKTEQSENSNSQTIRLLLRRPVLRVITVQPEVVVVAKQALQIQELVPTCFLTTVTAIQINDNDMVNDASISIPDVRNEDAEVAFGLNIATAKVVAVESMTNSGTLSNETEWSLVRNRPIDLADTLESPLSILSPLSPFIDTEELIDSYHRDEDLCQVPSTASDVLTVEPSLSVETTQKSCAEIIINGKPHAHPLRSHPVTEADFSTLPNHLAYYFTTRTDSLQSSEASSKGSVSEMISPKTTRPPFPPRKDSLMPLDSFLNKQTERPRTSHVPTRPSRADNFTTATNRSEISLATSSQRMKRLHRRSASVVDLFHSLTTKSASRSQSAPMVSAPILIQAPINPPTKASIPSKIQVPVHFATPYTMQPPFRSQTWNTSQLSTQSSANTSSFGADIPLTHSPSQTSLHSNSANRKAFVIQQRNGSVFSLHSQNSTQDLNGMFSGYDTHLAKDPIASPKTLATVPPVPPKHEEVERLSRRGSETVRIPAPVPVELKERRFRKVLNLRRANAVRYNYVYFDPSSGTATNVNTTADISCPFSPHQRQNIPISTTTSRTTFKRKQTNNPRNNQAFTSTLNGNSSRTTGASLNPNALSTVNEGGFDSRRGSAYAFAPGMMHIDVSNAGEVRRGSEFRGGLVGVRKR